jgi:hypothetical protein
MKSEVSTNTFFHVLLPAAAPEKPGIPGHPIRHKIRCA